MSEDWNKKIFDFYYQILVHYLLILKESVDRNSIVNQT
jgi:hypothetical protein